MADFFTSDQHFGHKNIIDFIPRPFTSVQEMNEEIIRRWNEVVTDNDTVYVVGDVAMGFLDESLPLVRRLNGHKILIPGNHDACHPAHKRYSKAWVSYYEGLGFTIAPWDEIWTYVFDQSGIRADLCHFPYLEVARHADTYSAYRPDESGDWLIHGHTHQTTVFSYHPRQFHVGVDAWDYYPVSASTIERLILEHG